MTRAHAPTLNGEISHWMRQAGPILRARPPLADSQAADVVIVGAGLTGLWAAWFLTRLAPQLTVRVLEAEQVGFGASGRNGGWLSHLVPGNRAIYARGPRGMAGSIALQRALIESVDEVLETARGWGLGIDAVRGGNTAVATTPAGLVRLRERREADLRYGLTGDEVSWLDPAALSQRIRISGALGGLHYPAVARIDPAKLVLGLADAVERAGAVIHEGSRVVTVAGGSEGARAFTAHGQVRRARCCFAWRATAVPCWGTER